MGKVLQMPRRGDVESRRTSVATIVDDIGVAHGMLVEAQAEAEHAGLDEVGQALNVAIDAVTKVQALVAQEESE